MNEEADKLNELEAKISLVSKIIKKDKDFNTPDIKKFQAMEKSMLEAYLKGIEKLGIEIKSFKEETLSKTKIINNLKNLGMSQEEIDSMESTELMYFKLQILKKALIEKDTPKPITKLKESVLKFEKQIEIKEPYHHFKDYITMGLITIGGNASSGKTMFTTGLIQAILGANDDTIAIIYSLDDAKEFLAKKMYSSALTSVLTKEVSDDDKKKIDNYDSLFERIYMLDHVNNFQRILLGIKSIQKKNKDKKLLVMIDYLQTLERLGDDPREAYNEIVKEMKKFVRDNPNVILFNLSQVNRTQKDASSVNIPFTFRETSEIENVSDVCIEIFKDDDEENSRTVKVIKNKRGSTNKNGFKCETNKFFRFDDFTQVNQKKSSKNYNEVNEKPLGQKTGFDYWEEHSV